MSWKHFIVELVKATASPTVVVIALLVFRRDIAGFLRAIEYFIRLRHFKASIPGASVETRAGDAETIQIAREQIEGTSTPPASTSAVQDTVEARNFILRDKEGKARAQTCLVEREKGSVPLIRFFDAEGNVRLGIGLTMDGRPIITCFDSGKKLQALITASGMSLAGNTAYFGRTGENTAGLVLFDKDGNETFSVP